MASAPLGVALLVGGLVLFALAWVAYRRRAVMADTPTSKVRGMAVGIVELSGVAEPAAGRAPLLARYSGQPCLSWRFALEEERTRVVTQVVNGKTITRTETYWETLDRGEERAPFALRDDTGAALLDPAGADLPLPDRDLWTSGRPGPTPAAQEALRRGGFLGMAPRRLTEQRLPAGTALYVLAEAARRDDASADAQGNDALVVRKPRSGPFIVSDSTERSLTLRWTAAFWAALIAGAALASGGVYVLAGGA